MALEYLSLFPDMRTDHFDALTAEEVGIIVLAALDYIGDGILPEFELRSVLDLTWRRVRRHIDACSAKVDKMSALGKAGGEASASKRKQAEAKRTQAEASEAEAEPSGDEAKATNNKYQKQKQTQMQKQKQEEVGDYGCDPAAAPAENVIAFDGSDLAEDIRRNNVADDMIADYNLPRDRVTRSALLEDIAAHGEARMREVLTTACQSNTRDKVTVNYWRAILNGKGRDSPKKDSGVGYGEVLRQREYSPDYWKSIEVNLEDE